MSIASVLERSGNVRDVKETPVLREAKLWDLVTDEDIINGFYNCWPQLPFMGLDVFSNPKISSYSDFFRRNALNNSESNSVNKTPRIYANDNRIEIYMEYMAISRFLEQDLSVDVEDKHELVQGKNKLKEIENDCLEGSPDIMDLDFIFDFKVCFPSEDVDFAIDSFLLRYENYIENSLKANIWGSKDTFLRYLRNLAILNLLKPDLFENINVANSNLYKVAYEEAELYLDSVGSVNATIVNLSTYLKFFAAEKAVLGPRGIELTMPKSLALPSSPTLPEIGRFEV